MLKTILFAYLKFMIQLMSFCVTREDEIKVIFIFIKHEIVHGKKILLKYLKNNFEVYKNNFTEPSK